MDKYTVDLDKVLNDFEYSELTEQNFAQNQSQYNKNQSYPKAPISTSKHSINNVFHSLNEYLNSDIKTEITNAGSSIADEIENIPTIKNNNDVSSIEEIFKSISNEDETVAKETIESEETIEVEVETKENQVESIEEEIIKNEVEIKENPIVDLKEDKIEVKVLEPVKFGELEVSDTEIENELAELEQQYEEETDNNQMEKDLKSELEEINNSVIVETDVNKTEDIAELEDCDKNVKEEINCDISEEKPVLDKTEKEEIRQENITIELIEESEQEIIERRGSIRPNSLDLNSESASDNLTINLIGAPGSTPYNNLYSSISTPEPVTTPTNTTHPATLEQHDLTTDSLSPTLSDASTYDNSQSDSNTTDSCNDTSLEETAPSSHTQRTRPDVHAAGGAEEGSEQQEGSGVNTEGDIGQRNDGDGCSERDDTVSWLGKAAPFWTPDSDALCCLHCNQKFTVIKRRHHCRACGLVLCSKCCNMKCKLQYMDNTEARVCLRCYDILTKVEQSPSNEQTQGASATGISDGCVIRPGNPMDYCSTVPPHQQVSANAQLPPAVLVPVGVLKRHGSGKSRSGKSVIFCDGIRPGCDLTELDRDFNYKTPETSISATNSSSTSSTSSSTSNSSNSNSSSASNSSQKKPGARNKNLPKTDPTNGSYIPKEQGALPPVVNVVKSDVYYGECGNSNTVVDMLKNETVTFAIQRNFHIQVRIINMDCCINKQAWCFATQGMISVGQDEIIILLEFIDNEKYVPKDVFLHLNNIYNDAVKGTSISEMGISIHPTSNFLESKNHAGFLYIKPTFQCIQNLILPKEPYLIGILIHRWETPWAKIFPLRLLLRLGAEYRYYPSPIISTRHRESVYVEIGHTIINLLADFRNFTYTLPSIRGLTIHMEDKNTVVSIPNNRYDQVVKALNNSSDHILAFAANFSPAADSHLVCIQDTQGNNENAYTTHAINIHNKPRKGEELTGASFIVLNGALKSSSGLTAKSSIVEDGLMIQIPPEHMQKLRTALRNMKDFKILCGPVNSTSDESVSIIWIDNDVNFNVGVTSPIDGMALSGIPSIRVHNGRDFVCNSGNKMIRWTEVFIIQSGEEGTRTTAEPVDVSRVSEAISKATSQALVKYLDLLATNSQSKIAIRVTLSIENVSYLAGSNGTKLPPIYMKSLDNELIPVLHLISAGFGENVTVSLELMFHILNC